MLPLAAHPYIYSLPHTIIDATHKSKYLWWNSLAQVERFQDCSGKSTYYSYDDRQHLVAVTDALNQTTKLERNPTAKCCALIIRMALLSPLPTTPLVRS